MLGVHALIPLALLPGPIPSFSMLHAEKSIDFRAHELCILHGIVQQYLVHTFIEFGVLFIFVAQTFVLSTKFTRTLCIGTCTDVLCDRVIKR